MYVRQIFGGSTPPNYLTDLDPSNVWGVYTPKIFDGCMCVKNLGGLHLQNIGRMWIRRIFEGVYTPQIFDECGSVNYLGGLHPENI